MHIVRQISEHKYNTIQKIVSHYPKDKKNNAQVQLISEHASKDKRLTNSTARAAPPVVVVHLCVTKCCTKKIQYCALSLLLSITKYSRFQNLIVTKGCTKKIQYCALSLLLSVTKYLMFQILIGTKCCTKTI